MTEDQTKEVFKLLTRCFSGIQRLETDVADLKVGFAHFNDRQDKFEEGQARLEMCNEKVEVRLGNLEVRMDGLDQRMDGLDQRMDGLDQRMDGFDQRMDGLEGRQGSYEEGQQNILSELRINNRILADVVSEQARLGARVSILEEKAGS